MEFLSDQALLRNLASWLGIGASFAMATVYFSFIGYHYLPRRRKSDSRLIELIDAHPRSSFGVPLSSVSAFCLVTLLQATSTTPIEISFFGFVLKGASGPVALWIGCFLANVVAVRVLWK